MELFIAIALLCQVTHQSVNGPSPEEALNCQQSYVHCVNLKTIKKLPTEALNECIQERKL